MIYENPYYKKVKGSYLMIVSCGYCKNEIIEYEKVGKGGLINMYIDRIIRGKIDLTKNENALICPNCKKQIGSRVLLKRENKEVFKMIRSAFNASKNY